MMTKDHCNKSLSTLKRTPYRNDKIGHFRSVELEDGISIHQTEVLDMYGTKQEMADARKKDPGQNWEALVKSDAFKGICGIGGPCFLDVKDSNFTYLPI